MRNYTFPLHLFQSFLLDQAHGRMERAADFECANSLEVLALEEQPKFWLRRFFPFPLCPFERIGTLGRRREVGQGRVCQDGRVVNVGLNESAGGRHRGTRQGECVSRV